MIEHREALVYMICEAAELEHALMCEYLFAAFSLKREGLSAEQQALVERWRSVVVGVAVQEMMHLAITANLLTALGASPHLSRPNLPQPARHYPPGIRLALLPFGEEALRHFLYLERPEGMVLDDAPGLDALGAAAPLMDPDEIVPRLQDFATVGHLYRSIEAGFAHLADKFGEARLFVGPPQAQVTAALFGWPELQPVTDVASATAAVEAIVEQGEGPRGEWTHAHFGRFKRVLDEYLAAIATDPTFTPAHPAVAASVRDDRLPLITDPITARAADLSNVVYEVLLLLLYRLFARIDETDEQVAALADVGIGLMRDALTPLGTLLATLPLGPEYPGITAGAPFELFYQPDYLLPHQRAAWTIIAERLDVAADYADALVTSLADVARVADALHRFATHLRPA